MALHWRRLRALPWSPFPFEQSVVIPGAVQGSLHGKRESILMVAEKDSRFRPRWLRAEAGMTAAKIDRACHE
jgi:hypothetical protein